jgi:hypothetical protein
LIASGFAASAVPTASRAAKRAWQEQRRRQQCERRQQYEQPVVVERSGKHSPRSGGEHGAREVRKVIEGDLPAATLSRRRVPALEPGVPVVVSVRVLAVEDEVACDVDLIGRVVHVVPGGGGVSQPDLQQRRRDDEQTGDDGAESDRPAAAPAIRPPGYGAGQRDEERGDHRRGAGNVRVPLLVGGADERSEYAVGMDVGGSEGPRAGAQIG